MIKNISIEQYRKLKNIEFEFNKGINILSDQMELVKHPYCI